MDFLTVDNLYKSFSGVQVLKGINFSLEKGEVVSVIGSSGSGKTTLLRCLNFLELADTGRILVNGEEIFTAALKYNDAALRKNRLHFGLVFQGFNLFPQYNALKNIQLPLDMQTKERLKQKKAAIKKEKSFSERLKTYFAGQKNYRAELRAALAENVSTAKTLLKEVGLGDKKDNYPCELSGGQCQRVAIARALALRPEILCFDEPTSALDPELTGEVLRVIRALKSPERAMIIVTHEMEFARDVSDKIIFMADGVIEETGTPQEIFENPKSEKTKMFLRHYAERR